jgi:transcriptional regulator with PAS, ATPase and Fis domain
MDSVTINLEDKNRFSLVMGSITLELVVKRPKDVTSETQADQPDTVSLSLGEMQKIQIQRVLDMCKGNKRRAAQILGISRTSLRLLSPRHRAKNALHSHQSLGKCQINCLN